MEKQFDPDPDNKARYELRAKEMEYISYLSSALHDLDAGDSCIAMLSAISGEDTKSYINILSSLSRLCAPNMRPDEFFDVVRLVLKADGEMFAGDHIRTAQFAYLISEIADSAKSPQTAIYAMGKIVSNCKAQGNGNGAIRFASALSDAAKVVRSGQKVRRIVDFMFSLRGHAVEEINAQMPDAMIPGLNAESVALGLSAVSIAAGLRSANPNRGYVMKYLRNMQRYSSFVHVNHADAQLITEAYSMPRNELFKETLATIELHVGSPEREAAGNTMAFMMTCSRAKAEAAARAVKDVAVRTKAPLLTKWMCSASSDLMYYPDPMYVNAMRLLSGCVIATTQQQHLLKNGIESANGKPKVYFSKIVCGAQDLLNANLSIRIPGFAIAIVKVNCLADSSFAAVSQALTNIAKNSKAMASVDIALIAECFEDMSEKGVERSRIIAVGNALNSVATPGCDIIYMIQFMKIAQMMGTVSSGKFELMLRIMVEIGSKDFKTHEIQYVRNKFLQNRSLSDQEFSAKMNAAFSSVRNMREME